MNLDFINNLQNISKKQLQAGFEAAVLMAAASSIFYVFYGSIFGINRIIGSMLKDSFSEQSRVKLTLISGLIFFSALIKTLYRQHLTTFEPFDSFSYTQNTSALRLIISGALIGFGSQYATIGTKNQFGFSGIPYFNIKSLLSGIILLVVACLTHTYKLFEYLPNTPRIIDLDLPDNITYNAYLLVFLLIPFICFVISKAKSLKTLISYISLFGIGFLLAYAMMIAGFTERKIVYSFFKLDKSWNPKMLVIFGYGLVIHLVVVLVMKFIIKKPLFNTEISPQNDKFRLNLITGTIIYGIGLGLGGLDPITVLLQLPLQSIKIGFYWGIPCIIGMKTAHKLFQTKVEQTPIQKTE